MTMQDAARRPGGLGSAECLEFVSEFFMGDMGQADSGKGIARARVNQTPRKVEERRHQSWITLLGNLAMNGSRENS
jgi:hypothetical protein